MKLDGLLRSEQLELASGDVVTVCELTFETQAKIRDALDSNKSQIPLIAAYDACPDLQKLGDMELIGKRFPMRIIEQIAAKAFELGDDDLEKN